MAYKSINRAFQPRGPSCVTAEEGPRGRNVLFINLYATEIAHQSLEVDKY